MSLRRMMLDKHPLKNKLFEGYGENKEEERRMQREIEEKTKHPGTPPRKRRRIVGKQPPTEEAGRAEPTETRRQRLLNATRSGKGRGDWLLQAQPKLDW